MLRIARPAVGVLAALTFAVPSRAEPLRVEAVLAPREQIRLDFQDGTRRFALLVRREGQATGEGVFANATVAEYGFHDSTPGSGADSLGYLVFTAPNGDVAYVQWRMRSSWVPGPGGQPPPVRNGYWEIVGGTGAFGRLTGAGTMEVPSVSPTDRRFMLRGEVAQRR